MKGRKKHIIFLDRGNASYIESDLEILTQSHEIKRHSFFVNKKWKLPFALFGQALFCVRFFGWADIIVVHFAGWNSFLPTLYARCRKKKSVLFLHGTDATDLPSINYGNFRKWPLSAVTKLSLRSASELVAVDNTLVRSTNNYIFGGPLEQGVKYFVPDLKIPIRVIPHGFDPELWLPGSSQRTFDFVTVGNGYENPSVRRLKGIDSFIALAKRCPEFSFLVVGWTISEKIDLPVNLQVLPKHTREDLIQIYQQSKCYAQLSLSEGFGCALVEAMFCGCVPLVSAVGAMPEIVGDLGVVVQYQDLNILETGVRKAIKKADRLNFDAVRIHAVRHYTLALRKLRLEELIDDLTEVANK